MIRNNDKILEDFINKDCMTLYTNAKGVHGGCYKVGGGCGWFKPVQKGKKYKMMLC
jgi:hypothetical protein